MAAHVLSSRRDRRAAWRKNISKLAQSKEAKGSGLDRAERRRPARELWSASTPNVTRVTPRFGHYMSARIDAMQRGLIYLLWRGQ